MWCHGTRLRTQQSRLRTSSWAAASRLHSDSSLHVRSDRSQSPSASAHRESSVSSFNRCRVDRKPPGHHGCTDKLDNSSPSLSRPPWLPVQSPTKQSPTLFLMRATWTRYGTTSIGMASTLLLNCNHVLCCVDLESICCILLRRGRR